MTGTASVVMIDAIKKSLELTNCSVVAMSPNRGNIYLKKIKRPSNRFGLEGYEKILQPIAEELLLLRDLYPMTIIYLKLKYCGYAYSLFEHILQSEQYVGESIPSSRLFAQFHSPQTTVMKEEIIKEIKNNNSTIRVLFATSALGMGVDASRVINIIHITPPDSLEAYFQEIGRAGRNNSVMATATLYYNNEDIGNNRLNVNTFMKNYCLLNSCLRKYLMNYFGFNIVQQAKCCSVCEGAEENFTQQSKTILEEQFNNYITNAPNLELELKTELDIFQNKSKNDFLYHHEVDVAKLIQVIMNDLELINNEAYFLNIGIYDEEIATRLFGVIMRHSVLEDQN